MGIGNYKPFAVTGGWASQPIGNFFRDAAAHLIRNVSGINLMFVPRFDFINSACTVLNFDNPKNAVKFLIIE